MMPLLAALSAFVLSLLFVPVVRQISFKLGKVSQPRKDRWHQKPTPTLGGIGMFAAFLLTVGGIFLAGGDLSEVRWSLLAASAIIFGLGLVDDILHITPPSKLIVQFVAAAVIVFFGRVINFFPWDFANIILTFFWLVGITNAINLLDNMDGLAGGIALIAAGFLSYFFFRAGAESLMILSMALAGSILGFLVFNFPPAKIFMGDSGSLFLGFTLAALAVAHRPRASDVLTVLGVPTLLFLLPIFDTSLVTITRLMRGQSPAQGGTDHTSHRLIAFGLNEKQALLVMYAVGIVSGLAGSILEALDYDLSLALIPLILIGLSLLVSYLGRMKMVPAANGSAGGLSRIMIDLTYKRRLLEIVLDFFLIGVSYYLAFWTKNGFHMSTESLAPFIASSPVALAMSYLAFYVFGVYRGLWRYIGIDDLLHYLRAAVVAALAVAIPLLVFFREQYDPVVFFLFGIFLFLGLAASRSSFRVLDRMYERQMTRAEAAKVLIYGAGDLGEMTLRWILNHPELGYRPVGLLDDDPMIWGRRIHGVTVLGGCEQIEAILGEKQPGGILVSNPDIMNNEKTSQSMALCRQKGLWVRLVKMDFELIE